MSFFPKALIRVKPLNKMINFYEIYQDDDLPFAKIKSFSFSCLERTKK